MIEHQGKILFSRKELSCRHCGKLELAKGFAEKLKELRLDFGQPMIVTSCCRCAAHNLAVKGKPGSYHLSSNSRAGGACAVDIKRQGYEYDKDLIITALNKGWSAGIGKTFIHLDRRADYGAPAIIFTY